MGWGPVDWVERVLPEAKLKNTTTLLFEIFRFERPIPRYLLKTVLPCKALGFSYGLITAVSEVLEPKSTQPDSSICRQPPCDGSSTCYLPDRYPPQVNNTPHLDISRICTITQTHPILYVSIWSPPPPPSLIFMR